MFQVFKDNQFVANKKKCIFGRLQVKYLGHVIYGSGVAMDYSKVKSIVEWTVPHNVKGVRGFFWVITKSLLKVMRKFQSPKLT